MKKDWSALRITLLLYIIVAMLPVNYYFVNRSFAGMKSDGMTMNRLVFINGAMQRVCAIEDPVERGELVSDIDAAMETIDRDFMQLPLNSEYVELFRSRDGFDALDNRWQNLKAAVESGNLSHMETECRACWNEVNDFSQMIEEMMTFKGNELQDIAYLSLVLTMLFVLSVIYLVRLYIRIQIKKHAIHDHATGLYNRKYFNEVLQKTQLLSTRRESPFCLLVISFDNYDDLRATLDRKEMRSFLHEFAQLLDEFFRHSDTICRIENNLFAVIAPDATLANGEKLAERLATAVSEHAFSLTLGCGVQIGVSSHSKESSGSLLKEATDAMLRSHAVVIGGQR